MKMRRMKEHSLKKKSCLVEFPSQQANAASETCRCNKHPWQSSASPQMVPTGQAKVGSDAGRGTNGTGGQRRHIPWPSSMKGQEITEPSPRAMQISMLPHKTSNEKHPSLDKPENQMAQIPCLWHPTALQRPSMAALRL